MIKRILVNVHKILGLLLSILFLMWFLSGFVMIFHSFPKISPKDRIARQDSITGNLPDIDNLLGLQTDSGKLRSLSLEMYLERPVFHLQSSEASLDVYADSLSPVGKVSESDIQQIVEQWCTAPIVATDTLWESDQWLQPGKLTNEKPVYKYSFADDPKHELYISAQSGRVLQFTDKDQRFWAWLGAIPHWVYFSSLRQNQPLWSNFVKWTSGIGCIMCLAGLILGIQIFWKSRKKGFKSPYKKRWFHWHYISGLLFGVFAITFAFSGLMSMTDLPDWMQKSPKKQQGESPRRQRGAMHGKASLRPGDYILDYRSVVAATDGVKNLEWAAYQNKPYYKVTTNDSIMNIDASDSLAIRPFILTESMVRRDMDKLYGDSIAYSIELINEYDDQYYSRKKNRAPLPVYRVIVDNDLHTRHYYNPETLSQQRFDDDSRMRRFLYSGLHSLNFKTLTDRPILWNIVMFTLLIGGTFLSLTGVVLSIKWIIRKSKRIYKYINTKK